MNVLTFLNYLKGIFNTNLTSGTVQHAVLQSIYDSFLMVDGDLDLMRLELCISTASGKWLDYWGDFFTVHRKLNESDEDYSKRIIEYVIRPKTTVPAIKSYLVEYINELYHTEYTDNDIVIKEPWKDLGKYSHKGTLSNDSRFFSGSYYCHSILDISIPEKLTQDIVDLVLSVKAAGVKVVWSFLNSYDVIKGYEDSDSVVGEHSRHIFTETHRNQYGGLLLSTTSFKECLSGKQEIWIDYQSNYYWYAKMLDKDTDKSIIITKSDLVALLDIYNTFETILVPKDTGMKPSIDEISRNLKKISGEKTETEVIRHLINITDIMFQTMNFIDDWLTLSQIGKLSTSEGTMIQFEAGHELFNSIMNSLKVFKKENEVYYSSLQPPIKIGEQVMWLVQRNLNWLFDSPAVVQADFYELWGVSEEDEHNTLADIERFEDLSGKKYLTFGDVYQPPIVIAGSPWDWTPIIDSPWLWKSATLNNEELEEIYRTKFSSFPDLVDIQTYITTHPENSFTLSENSTVSPVKFNFVPTFERKPELSLTLSSSGTLNQNIPSGSEITITYNRVDNPEFKGYTYVSGDESIITKKRVVRENVPTLGAIIDLEENQNIFNPNEEIKYSTREWFQAPVQIGIYAMWLILPNERQFWNTITMTNEEIMSYWEGGTIPSNFETQYLNNTVIYQPPIVRTDSPYYWATDHTDFDHGWLYESETLTNDDLQEVYRSKFAKYPDAFADLITVQNLAVKTPENEFRLSDNGYFTDVHIETKITETKNLDKAFKLSDNGVISNRKTEYRTDTQIIPRPEESFSLSNTGTISSQKYTKHVDVIHHPEKNFILGSGELNSPEFQISGGEIENVYSWIDNPDFTTYKYISGNSPEVIKTITEITYDQVALKQLSGDATLITVDKISVVDTNGTHKLDGEYTTYKEVTNIVTDTITLEQLINLDELQINYPFSTRDRAQAPIFMGEQVMWYVSPNETQLWNTIVLTNREILHFWEGKDRPRTIKILGKHIYEYPRYQPPIEMTDEPFYFIISRNDTQLWNTPATSNEYIMSFWVGEPISEEEFQNLILNDLRRYQLPIDIADYSGFGMILMEYGQLWDTPIMSNDEIMSFWDGSDYESPEEFVKEYTRSTIRYQSPIQRDKRPFYWLNDHTDFDAPWLKDVDEVNLEIIDAYYRNKLNNPTLLKLRSFQNFIELAELQMVYELSQDVLQAPIVTNGVMWLVGVLEPDLWNSQAISKSELLEFWDGEIITDDQFARMLNDLPIYQLPIQRTATPFYWLNDHTDFDEPWIWNSGIATLDELEEYYRMKFDIYDSIDSQKELTLQDLINLEELNLVVSAQRDALQPLIMIGEQAMWLIPENVNKLWNTLVLTNDEIMSFWDSDPISDEEFQAMLDQLPRYQPPIEIKDMPSYWLNDSSAFNAPWLLETTDVTIEILEQYYKTKLQVEDIDSNEIQLAYKLRKDIIQNPILMGEQVMWLIPENKTNLWNTEIITNDDILSFWDSGEITPNEFESMLNDLPRYQSPIQRTATPFYWLNDHTDFDEPWIWNSGIATLDELEEYYRMKFDIYDSIDSQKELTLQDLINLEELYLVVSAHRDALQPLIMIGEQAMWLIKTHETKFWNSEVMVNNAIMTFWEGDPITKTQFESMLDDLPRYQPPINIIVRSTSPIQDLEYYTVPVDYPILWNTETITNDDILTFWDGSGDFDEQIKLKQYQSPIQRTATPFYWLNDHIDFDEPWIWNSGIATLDELEEYYRMKFDIYDSIDSQKELTLQDLINLEELDLVVSAQRDALQPLIMIGEQAMWKISVNERGNLWDSPAITNDEILSYGNGLDLALVQPLISITKQPFYWVNDHEEFDAPWSYESETITLDDLDSYYKHKYALSTEGELTLEQLIELEELDLVESLNADILQSPIMIGEQAMWLIQVQNTSLDLLSDSELREFWDGSGLIDLIDIQAPISITKTPFYWVNDHEDFDEPWVFESPTLTLEELNDYYQLQYGQEDELTLEQLMELEESNNIQKVEYQSPIVITPAA